MTVKEIVAQHLKDNGFTGLLDPDQGCGCDGSMPCNNWYGNCSDCQPAYKNTCPGRANCPDGEVCESEGEKGQDCFSLTKREAT